MKKLVAMGLASTLVFSMAACSNGDSADKGAENGKKVVQVAYPSWWEGWLKDLEKDFEAKNKDVDVKLVPLSAQSGDIYSKLAMMMKSPKTAPDVAIEDTFMINSDVNAGYLDSLEDRVKEWDDWGNFVETTKKGVAAEDGKIYGVPFSTDVQGLWYNKKQFEKAGLPVPFEPKSWAEVQEAAEKIKDTHKEVIPMFMYGSKATGEASSMRTFQLLYSGTGSQLYDFDAKKWVVDEKALNDTFGFINDIYSNDLGPSMSIVSNGQISTALATDYMPQEKVAMVVDGNWVPGLWRSGKDKPWPEALDTYGFTAFPTQNGEGKGKTSMSGGWAFSIAKNADEKDLAWEFIKMATDKEQQMKYVTTTGDMTVRSDVAENNEYLDQELSNYREAGEILNYTNFRPAVDKYPSVSTMIQEVVETVVAGKASPKDAVKAYEQNLKRIVGEENVTVK